MPHTIKTTGEVGTDREIDALWASLTAAIKRVATLEGSKTVTLNAVQDPVFSASSDSSSNIVVSELDGSPSVSTNTIYLDQADGFVLTEYGGGARINHNGVLSVAAGTNVTIGGTATVPIINATVSGSGFPILTYQAKSADYTAVAGDAVFMTGTHTVTLPAASSNSGKIIVVKNDDSSASTVTVAATSGDTIDITSITNTSGKTSLWYLSTGGSRWGVIAGFRD